MALAAPASPPGTLNWRALAVHDRFLVRRLGRAGDWLVAVGARSLHETPPAGQWSHGHVAYALKDRLEPLRSRLPQEDDLPLCQWAVPHAVLRIGAGSAEVLHHGGDLPAAQQLLHELRRPSEGARAAPLTGWRLRTDREHYLAQVAKALAHIQRGDVYELNYCVERSTRVPGWDPFAGFARLMAANPAPYAAFHRCGDLFALCASPERYLRIAQGRITAQPMKGTRRRHADPLEDARLALELAHDAKERSENIMAVDVMRNDLSRVAAPRSVRVDELCGVHAYPHVHQMISTITAALDEGRTTWDAVRTSFPMASMTGAPKLRAMELIDELEDMPRGLFSGTLGIVSPEGDTDLNVVIRTVTYNAATGRASLITGSAITAGSDPALEWEECALKADSVLNALGHEG
ncbi:MAG: anthranilate synthase component I family protein [Flavobacteriales bacterium]|nr:anthranilate synthase component I family protein [Flavobacteriales bacterium]